VHKKISLPIKVFVARLMCNALTGSLISFFFRGRVPSEGVRVRVPDTVGKNVSAKIFWGLYESAERSMVNKHLKPGLNVLELGSSLGVVSSRIAAKLRAGQTLVCVEGNHDLIESLQATLRAPSHACTVKVVNAIVGAGSMAGASFRRSKDHVSSKLVWSGTADDSSSDRSVPVLGYGSLVQQLPSGPYALVCDIEGAEHVFLSEPGSLADCRQLIIELHDTQVGGREVTVGDLVLLVEAQGMRLKVSRWPVFLFERS
jgi:FkbM family methyltransferase